MKRLMSENKQNTKEIKWDIFKDFSVCVYGPSWNKALTDL